MEGSDNGYYRFSWGERIGFNSGELAQNLIYQTVSIWLLFYYNNVFGLDAADVAVMFLVVRIIDVLWDPMVGAFVDKSRLPWGKYRSWLLIGGLPSYQCTYADGEYRRTHYQDPAVGCRSVCTQGV